MNRHILTRRDLLRLSALAAGCLAITACQSSTGIAPGKASRSQASNPADAIPRDVAWQLCAEIRAENQGKWYAFNGLWCLGCQVFAQGDLTKMCVSGSPDYRGCAQVNARYERGMRSGGA